MKVLRAGEGVRLVRDVLIPMRDGVRWRRTCTSRMPGDGRAGPARRAAARRHGVPPLPQGRGRPGGTLRHYLELPRNGYIVARVDIRGTGGSEGHAVDEYVAQEQEDGYDAIEWMAAQPWCDGHVNMIGISYGGFTALQVATLQPPHLTSIIPVDFTDDRYTDDCHYRGGLMRMYYDVGYYGTRMVAWNAMPTDPTFAAERRARDLGAPRRRGRAVPPRLAPPPGRRAVLAPGVGRRTSPTGSSARRSSSAAGATATRTRRSACSSA